ncbi:MAG: undecaprenyl-diphosphate phosphatase [Kiritimatiellae bacterium]|nr:undecaprenyl-diphosphate phosphatase [Kiritimatiellia bacterium]
MQTVHVLILAAVQGLTEFLPVSSSGHLVLAQRALGVQSPGPELELFLHLGTLASICVFYRRRLLSLAGSFFRGERAGWLYAAWVFVSAVPAGLFYKACGDRIDAVYDSHRTVAALMVFNGVLLLLSALADRRKADKPLGFGRALAMGAGQALAILPGVSRSGTSISAGRLFGLGPKTAAEFSFVMSIPVIAGAAVLEFLSADGEGGGLPGPAGTALAATAVAALVGWIALRTVVRLLERGAFWTFGPYCIAAGAAALLFL